MKRLRRTLRQLAAGGVGAAALCLAALAACADRLTAPQAERLVRATEAVSRGKSSDSLELLWMELALPARQPGALSRVIVHDGPRRREFVALVHERVMVPEGGLSGGHCWGTRRVLFLQSSRAIDERLTLHGVDFALPVQYHRDSLCAGDDVPYRAPHLFMGRVHQGAWVGTGGRASISPATSLGPCTILSADAERLMREQYGMTCELTTHQVELNALLKPELHRNGATYLGSSARRVAIPMVEVRGVRVTIDCAATQWAAESCRARQ